MKSEHQLRAEYSDVLDDSADAALLRIVGRLDTTLASRMSEAPRQLTVAIDRAVEEQSMMLRERTRVWPRLLPLGLSRRAGAIAASLLLVIVLTGATFAAMPALHRLYEAHTGTGAIISNGLGHEVDVSQTFDGFTVTAKQVYADPNQIAIGLLISGPAGRTFNTILPLARSPMLIDNQGRSFRGGPGGAQGGVEDGTAAYLLTYDGNGIAMGQEVIDVQLTIGELRAYERLEDNRFRWVSVAGPFVLDLTIPVEPGRVAELGQTVESDNVSVTLERVVTSPTGTRVTLRGAGPNADVRLAVGGETYRLHLPDGMAFLGDWSADSEWDYVTGTSLQQDHGQWTLTVQSAPGPSGTQTNAGPWTFRFDVP